MPRRSKSETDSDPGTLEVKDLAQRMHRDPGAFKAPDDLVSVAGVNAAQFQSLFRQHYHCTPAELLTRLRIERAGQQLLASDLAIDEVAANVGYDVPAQFERDFRHRMGLSSQSYRQLVGADEFELELPPYFVADQVLRYLGRDPASETERVAANTFTYGAHAGGEPLQVTVDLRPDVACCRIKRQAGASGHHAASIHAQVRRLLGLVIDPRPFERRAPREDDVARLIGARQGLTIPQTATLFDALVWVIAGQQVSLPVAFALRRRLARRIGTRLSENLYAPPTVQQVAELDPEDLHQSGFSRPKTGYLLAIAREIVTGDSPLLKLEPSAATGPSSATSAERLLLDIRGFGPWSANYLMMRACGFVDCVPIGDAALTRNLKRFFDLPVRPDADATRELMKPFAPHRSLATFHIWAYQGEEQ